MISKEQNTSRHRENVGVPKEEARLHRVLIKGLKREELKPGLTRIICSEVDCWNGIADVVVATANGARLFNHLSRAQLSSISLTTARILTRLSVRRCVSVEDLSSMLGMSQETVRSHVSRLITLKIASVQDRKIRLTSAAKSPFKEVTAFEVKTKDWRRGLYQATHYKVFANRVALALPEEKARNVAAGHSEVFKKFGVGLLGLSPDSFTFHIRPKKREPISPSRALMGAVELLKRREAKFLRQL